MTSSSSPSVFRFLRTNPDRTARISFGLTAGVLLFLMGSLAQDAASAGERMVMIRYLNFVFCGFFAFIIPHLRFPDKKRYLLQAMNLPAAGLFRYAAAALFPLFGLFTAMLLLLAFFDPQAPAQNLSEKATVFLAGWALMAGIGTVAAVRYSTIGSVSQEWQEGKRGTGLLGGLRQIGQSPSMPPGSFPSIVTTVSVSAGGMLLVVAGAWLGAFTQNPLAEILPGALLLGYGLLRIAQIRPVFDRFFYHTNAFYAELFLNPKAVQEGREPLRHEALYWVPRRWKPAVWFSLLQLDRRQPLGRIMVVMHLILWTAFYAGLSDAAIATLLSFIILGKSLMSYMLITRPFAPLLFQYRLLAPTDWILVRFFVNLRWLPLLLVSLWAVSLLSARVDTGFILQWAAIDAGISLAAALLFTLLHEFRLKSLYA
ncbi:MAG: hypothetical protein JJU35_02225 [Balneolales bacterium]|nr:hypothetical protein [Balneolales bacterium]